MSLNSESIANNSFIDIDSIGSNDTSALLCHINSTGSCNGTITGNWFYHNGTPVTTFEDIAAASNSNETFFVTNRNQSVIQLHQFQPASDSSSEIGHFYCVADDNKTRLTLNVYICKLRFYYKFEDNCV